MKKRLNDSIENRSVPDNQTRRQLFRWLGWFAMANAVIFGLIGLRYLSGGPTGATPLAWIYLVTIYISHHSWLALLPLLLLVSPVILLRPSLRWSKTLAVLLMAVMIAVIMLDSLLWSQSRFHINILTLKILGSSSLIFAAVMFVIAMLFEFLLAGRIWLWLKSAPVYRGRLLGRNPATQMGIWSCWRCPPLHSSLGQGNIKGDKVGDVLQWPRFPEVEVIGNRIVIFYEDGSKVELKLMQKLMPVEPGGMVFE